MDESRKRGRTSMTRKRCNLMSVTDYWRLHFAVHRSASSFCLSLISDFLISYSPWSPKDDDNELGTHSSVSYLEFILIRRRLNIFIFWMLSFMLYMCFITYYGGKSIFIIPLLCFSTHKLSLCFALFSFSFFSRCFPILSSSFFVVFHSNTQPAGGMRRNILLFSEIERKWKYFYMKINRSLCQPKIHSKPRQNERMDGRNFWFKNSFRLYFRYWMLNWDCFGVSTDILDLDTFWTSGKDEKNSFFSWVNDEIAANEFTTLFLSSLMFESISRVFYLLTNRLELKVKTQFSR